MPRRVRAEAVEVEAVLAEPDGVLHGAGVGDVPRGHAIEIASRRLCWSGVIGHGPRRPHNAPRQSPRSVRSSRRATSARA